MLFFGWFACSASLASFCVEELRAAATALGVHITLQECPTWLCADSDSSSFCVFDAASIEVAQQISERCVLLRTVYLLFAAAPSVEDLLDCIRESRNSSGNDVGGRCLRGAISQHLQDGNYAPLRIETVGRRYSAEEKAVLTARVTSAMGLPESTSSLHTEVSTHQKQALHRVCVVLEHAVENAPSGSPASWLPSGRVLRVFCGSLVVESPRQALLVRYDLKRRPYIGTTSMPPEPAFVMVHMACVRRGAYVFDPFCGTGGILVAAAHYGAITLGADVDGRAMQHGTRRGLASIQQKQQREVAMRSYPPEGLARAHITTAEAETPSMLTNFKLYGLPPPDRVRMNFASWHATLRPCSSRNTSGNDPGFLDAIVTDPPYGIREPQKKAAPQEEEKREGKEQSSPPPPPGEQSRPAGEEETHAFYPLSSIVLDLLLFAAEALVVGGRLVLWYPTTPHYTNDELPTHPSLRLLCNIPQRVSLKIVRHLIVMEKTHPLPFPRPSRESCAAKRQAQNLRALMDETDLPGNSEYMHYRTKLLKKRDAAKRYHSSFSSPCQPNNTASDPRTSVGNDSGSNTITDTKNRSDDDKVRADKRNAAKKERQELIVANRERNLQQRQHVQPKNRQQQQQH